jgi:hypothetical protein
MTSTDVVDPRTGQVLDLESTPHEQLIDAFAALQVYEQEVKAWRTAAEDELVRRHGKRRAAQVVGTYEVDVEQGQSREWDADELAGVVGDLVERGELSLDDVNGLITQQPKVDGKLAQKLLNRLEGQALMDLRGCFKWKQGRARAKVTKVVQLPEP